MNNQLLEFISPHKYKPAKNISCSNIRFAYMYRDAGNNKLRDVAIFTNNSQLTLCQIAKFVEAAFIKEAWFDPDLCGIERLHFEQHDSDLDHDWHQIETVSLTKETATMEIDIADFLFNAIKAHTGWVTFDCEVEEIEFEV